MVGGWREVEARKNWQPKRGESPKNSGRLEGSRGQKKLEAENVCQAEKWWEDGEK